MDNNWSGGDGVPSRSTPDAAQFQDFILPLPPPGKDSGTPSTERRDTTLERTGAGTDSTSDVTASNDPFAKFQQRYKPEGTTSGAADSGRSPRMPGTSGGDTLPEPKPEPKPGPDKPGPDNPDRPRPRPRPRPPCPGPT